MDAGGVLAWANGDGDARAAIERARSSGYAVVIPSVVVAQVHRGGQARAGTGRIFKAVDAIILTSDRPDIGRLLDGQPGRERIAIVEV